ncbi:MAG: hypothetical protein ACFFCS_26185 [Candidatus Hodarchaeota archaeon]
MHVIVTWDGFSPSSSLIFYPETRVKSSRVKNMFSLSFMCLEVYEIYEKKTHVSSHDSRRTRDD